MGNKRENNSVLTDRCSCLGQIEMGRRETASGGGGRAGCQGPLPDNFLWIGKCRLSPFLHRMHYIIWSCQHAYGAGVIGIMKRKRERRKGGSREIKMKEGKIKET